MNWLRKARRLAHVIGVITLGLGTPHFTRGAGAYLPAVGPCPLRFELMAANSGSFALTLFSPPTKPAPVTSAAPNPATNQTHAADLPAASAPGTNQPVMATATATAKPLTNTELSTISPLPDDNIVTPQMVAEYFQPVLNGTNQAAGTAGTMGTMGTMGTAGTMGTMGTVAVPVDLGFTPPSARAAQSQATYKIQ